MNARARDRGFTLIELRIVIAVQGIIVTAVATAFMTFLRAEPGTEVRLDDARSTRGLQTWLSHDTMSAPAISPPGPQGGIYLPGQAPVPVTDCGAPAGTTRIVHMWWLESGLGGHSDRFYVEYRYEVVDGEARIVRLSCWSRDDGAVADISRSNLTTGVDLATPPSARLWRIDPAAVPADLDPGPDVVNADPTNPAFPVGALIIEIKARGGQTVELVTSSRNPTESFPP